MPKKVLIFYTSIGLGHKTIAENIGADLTSAGHQVSFYDILAVEQSWLTKLSEKLYLLINRFWPGLWNYFYHSNWVYYTAAKLRMLVAAHNYRRAWEIIEQKKPDVIITTQTSASAVISYLKTQKQFTGEFGIAFSDFHLHRFWLYPNADFYLANIEEQKQEMVSLGIAAEKIFVCGMSLQPRPQIDADGVKQRLHIPIHHRIVLLASGSLGNNLDYRLINNLAKEPQVSVLAVCGRNRGLAKKIKQLCPSQNVFIFEYYRPMQELYAIADVFVSKPGGLSVAESLAFNLPMVVSHLLPGQEQDNYGFLMKTDLVLDKGRNIFNVILEELRLARQRAALKTNPHLRRILLPPNKPREALLHGV